MSLRTRRFARHALTALCLLTTGFAAGCGETETPAGDEHLQGDDERAAFEAAFVAKDDDKADRNNCSGVRLPDQGDFGGRVALTFDDGPNPSSTNRVLATLRERGIPAAFFMQGSNTEGETRQALIANIAQDPLFIVANHSWSHADLSKQTAARLATEIDRTNSSLADATGEAPKYFRFPYGAATCAGAEAVRERGMTITGWHIDSADWCFASGHGRCKASTFQYVPDRYREDMVGYVLSQVRSYNGGIVLFHDVHGATADALPQVLDALIAAGYTFTTLDDAETFPRLNGVAPAPKPFVGTACTTDDQCNFASGEAEGLCHSAGFCVLACAGACPDSDGHAPTFCIADEFQRAPDGPGGICVPQASDLNGDCADLPGTLDLAVDRFVGTSNASHRQARACVPVASEPAPAQ